MNICNDNHDEICYDQRYCPLCKAIQENADLQDEYNKLEKELEELKTKEV